MGKWHEEAQDGVDEYYASGSDDGFEVSFSAEIAAEMGGSSGDGCEAAQLGFYGSTDHKKSDDALKRQRNVEAKFKALADSTPANLTGPPSPLTPTWQAFPREAQGGIIPPRMQQLQFQELISRTPIPVRPLLLTAAFTP